MFEMKKIEIGWETLWRVLVFAIVVYVLIQARMVVGVFLVSVVISLGLDPFVTFLERLKFPRLLGSFITFLIGLTIIASAMYFVVPFGISEVGNFASYVSEHLSTLLKIDIPSFSLSDVRTSLNSAFGFFGVSGASIGGAIGGAIGSIFLRGTFVIATIMMSFYLTVEKDGAERFLKAILPDSHERGMLSVFSAFKVKIRRWFSAQLFLSIVVGTVSGFGMWLLGVKYAFVLGILAAIFELVPMIGPVIAGSVSFLVAITDTFSLGLYTLIFYMLVQQLENNVLIPLVMGRAMKVHPLMTIISILTGGVVAGFIGMILAVPIAVFLQEIILYFAEQKRNKSALI
ncbi:MAG: AI-2E family transporter [Candidatus Paceibacterota bacterium]|jgi:predicted PurR-regulated permease PerM